MDGVSDTYARLMQDQQSKGNLNSRPTNMPNGPSFTAAVASLQLLRCQSSRLASIPQLLPSHVTFKAEGIIPFLMQSDPPPVRLSLSIFNRHPRRNGH